MKIDFWKYHGTGNDFLMLDDRDNKFPIDHDLIRAMCHRRFGAGADGLILIRTRQGFDFEMPYFNSDGIESTMCGNGGRCAIAFADFLSLIHGEGQFCTIDGSHKGIILEKNGNMALVNLSMNEVEQLKQFPEGIVIDTGSPHLVIFDKNIDEIDVLSRGRKLRYANTFAPAGINVDFAEILPDGKSIYVRTYERGVEDETLSCGTGVTAAALALGSRLQKGHVEIGVITRGGNLKVRFERTTQVFRNIWLEGPAVRVYKGNFEF